MDRRLLETVGALERKTELGWQRGSAMEFIAAEDYLSAPRCQALARTRDFVTKHKAGILTY